MPTIKSFVKRGKLPELFLIVYDHNEARYFVKLAFDAYDDDHIRPYWTMKETPELENARGGIRYFKTIGAAHSVCSDLYWRIKTPIEKISENDLPELGFLILDNSI